MTRNKPDKVNQAILLLSNRSDDEFLKLFAELRQQAEAKGEVAVLFHKADKKPLPGNIAKINHFVFTDAILKDLGYTPIADKLLPGSNHFPLLKFFLDNPYYEYYWLIEDDVRFPPGWDHFFNFLADHNEDFLSCHLKTFEEEPNWCWWSTLTYRQHLVCVGERLKSFNPIYRLSNDALEFLHQCLSNGWSGHHETLIPTLLKRGQFTVGDLGGKGQFTSAKLKNKFYEEQASPLSSLASMRYRPLVKWEEIREPVLYHPVKQSV